MYGRDIMKKMRLVLLLIISTFVITSCSLFNKTEEDNLYSGSTTYNYSTETEFVVPESDNPNGYTITYVCNNGDIVTSKSNLKGCAIDPGAPTKICATFKGWYSDSDLNNLYDFSTKVKGDMTLYGGWDISYTELATYVYQSTVLANVKIKSQNYKYSYGKYTRSSSISQGSGVIFYEDSFNYYILTNNHVCAVSTDYNGSYYSVIDCYGNLFGGNLTDVKILAMDADYDLAILVLSKSVTTKELKTVDILTYDIKVNEEILSLTSPKGLMNTISFGKVLRYVKYIPDKSTINLNNITFDVLVNDSFIDNGSSGGMLLDTNLKIAGIQFASSSNSTDEYLYSYAIPATKILEFLNKYM